MADSAGTWLRTEAIFHEASALREPERTAVLEARCAGDTTLMAELRSLLDACEREQQRATAAPETMLPPRRIGPYAVGHLIGRGGMGAVYLAHRADGQFEQRVAIKLIDMPLSTELFRERFRTERQILAGLSHPYIARLLDGGVSNEGELYLAMEYIDGVSMTRFCEERGLSIAERLKLFRKVCEAVQYAHQNLVVHRDLKPDNILVVEDGTPRLLDFGTAKIVSPLTSDVLGDVTLRGMQTFTPRYASPEQVMGTPITVASDIYSLGVLLFVTLTGRQPYELTEYTTEEMVRVIVGEQPARPSAGAMPFGRLDAELDSIVLKALRKEPQQRYATVEQMAADIEAYLEQRPVLARRGDFRYRAVKFARRNAVALGAACLVLLAVVGGTFGTLVQSRNANRERLKAEARASDLRQLSNSMLSEIDDAIKDLPGSTPVQHLLVNRVLEHLDRMSRESSTDPETALDVLTAYTKLANVQGNPLGQNIGDPAGALQSLDRAEAAAAQHHFLDSSDPVVLGALGAEQQTRTGVLHALGRDREAGVALSTSLRVLERRLSFTHPSAADYAELAKAYSVLGDARAMRLEDDPTDPNGAVAAFRRSLDLSARALALDPKVLLALREVPVVHMKLGAYLQDSDPEAALKEERLSLDAFAAFPPALQATQTLKRGKAYAYRQFAGTLFSAGDYAGAIGAFDQARQLDEPFALADPSDTSASYDLANDLRFEADVYALSLDSDFNPDRAGDEASTRRAIDLYRRSMELMDHLVQLVPDNPTWLASNASSRAMLGTLQQRTEQAAEGAVLARNGISVLRRMASGPGAPVIMLLTATEVSLFIQPAPLRDPKWTLAAAERLVVGTQHRSAEALGLLARAANDAGNFEQARTAAQEGSALLTGQRSPATADATRSRDGHLLTAELARTQALTSAPGQREAHTARTKP